MDFSMAIWGGGNTPNNQENTLHNDPNIQHNFSFVWTENTPNTFIQSHGKRGQKFVQCPAFWRVAHVAVSVWKPATCPIRQKNTSLIRTILEKMIYFSLSWLTSSLINIFLEDKFHFWHMKSKVTWQQWTESRAVYLQSDDDAEGFGDMQEHLSGHSVNLVNQFNCSHSQMLHCSLSMSGVYWCLLSI